VSSQSMSTEIEKLGLTDVVANSRIWWKCVPVFLSHILSTAIYLSCFQPRRPGDLFPLILHMSGYNKEFYSAGPLGNAERT
jgi:hypothetical protein